MASDLTEIIKRYPREMASFIRAAKGLTAEEMGRFARALGWGRARAAARVGLSGGAVGLEAGVLGAGDLLWLNRATSFLEA